MTANGKIQITINNTCGESDFCPYTEPNLHQNRVIFADAIVRTTDLSTLSLLEVRLLVPARAAEELMIGMVKGDTEIVIGKISPAVDPN